MKSIGALMTATCALTCPALADTTGTAAQIVKIRDSIVYSEDHMYSAFPSVVMRPDGELICAFRRAPSRRVLYGAKNESHTDANSYLVSVRSNDGGETWTTSPELIHAYAYGGSQDPCLLQLSDGTLLCTSYAWAPIRPDEMEGHPPALRERGFGFLGGYLVRSSDNGKSWEGPIYPPVLPGEKTKSAHGTPRPTYNRGALLQTNDGTIQWAVVRSEETGHTSVHLIESRDGGTSWTYRTQIAADENLGFNETSLIQTRDGQLVAFLRTTHPEMKAAMARSLDGGETFEPWEDLGWSGLPLHAIQLKKGGILLVYGYRAKPFGVRARLVADDLSDVKSAPEFVVRDDAGNRDVGYPWAVELDDDQVLVVYYINKQNGTRHIAATLLEVQRSE